MVGLFHGQTKQKWMMTGGSPRKPPNGLCLLGPCTGNIPPTYIKIWLDVAEYLEHFRYAIAIEMSVILGKSCDISN